MPRGVGTRFNVCWHTQKCVIANDMATMLHLHQFTHLCVVHKIMCKKVQMTMPKLIEKFTRLCMKKKLKSM